MLLSVRHIGHFDALGECEKDECFRKQLLACISHEVCTEAWDIQLK